MKKSILLSQPSHVQLRALVVLLIGFAGDNPFAMNQKHAANIGKKLIS